MNQKDFEKFLTERYKKEIEWYDKKASKNQFWFKALSAYIICVSIAVPILISVLNISQAWVKILASFLSATVALAVGINNLFQFHENWINYRTTCETLKKEKSYYLGNVDDYARTEDKKALFIERVESIISRENTLWLTTQKLAKNKENK